MSRGRRPRSTKAIKQKNFGEDKGEILQPYPEIDVLLDPDSKIPYHKLTLSLSSIQRVVKDCGIPEARRADFTNFLKTAKFNCAILQFASDIQLTRKQLVKKLNEKLDAAKDLVQGLEYPVRVIQTFQLEQIRQEKYGGRFYLSSFDEATAFVRDRQRSNKEVADDVAAANRLVRRMADTVNWLKTQPETSDEWRKKKLTSAKPIEEYLATAVFVFWTRWLGGEARVTKALVAFANHVYRIMGYEKKPPALRKQLDDARKATEAASEPPNAI
jgi:hypothetical protein